MQRVNREVVDGLRKQLDSYRAKRIPVESLKAAIWESAQALSNVEAADLRRSLQAAEGRIDILAHTVDAADLFHATLDVVAEARLREALGD